MIGTSGEKELRLRREQEEREKHDERAGIIAHAIGEALGHPPGLRFFGGMATVKNLGLEDKVIRVGGSLCLWPECLGAPPSDEQVNTWVTEYEARRE